MALKCDACGYDNKDDALMCNLCGKIFRKENKREPEATLAETAQSAGPPSVSSPGVTSPSGESRPETIDGLDAMGWHEQGVTCLQQDQAAAALECYEKALAIEPRFTKAWGNRAALLHLMGRNEEAYECVLAALAIDPLDRTCWFTKAVVEHGAGRHAQAMRSFREVLSYPGDLLEDSLQQAQAAVQSLQAEGVQPAEREALGWVAEGTLRGRERELARALSCFDKAIELDPEMSIAWHSKSSVLSRLNRFEDALVCDEKALERDATNPAFWHAKGMTLKNLMRYDEALASYDRAIELDKNNPTYWSDRGLVLGNLECHEDAVVSFAKAIALAPRAATPWLNKALAEEALNRSTDAIDSYERFLELSSPDLSSHIQHAKSRIDALRAERGDAGSLPSAGAVIAEEVTPSAVVPDEITGAPESTTENRDWFAEARALEQAGKYEDAIDCVDQGLAAELERADAWYVRGCCLQWLGELEEAIASLDRSIELDAKRAEAWYHKGVSEQLSGAKPEAARSLEMFLSLASPDGHRAIIEDVRHRQKKLAADKETASGSA